MAKVGIVLVNIGTPKTPETKDVAIYLREFLMDPLVITLPFLFRWILVNLIIVPLRAPKSAEKYKKVWTKEGSPLAVHSEALAKKLGAALPYPVEAAMHYGEPSLRKVLKKYEAMGLEKIIVVPMYPQFAEATTGSTKMRVKEMVKKENITTKIEFTPPFYDDEEFLASWVRIYKDKFAQEGTPDHVLFTFHGLPQSQIKTICESCKTDGTCCAVARTENKDCYRMQCVQTAKLLSSRLALSEENWSVSFQSRLGRAEWIRPYTEDVLASLAQKGKKKIAVLCPAFTADCLETIEEIGIEGLHTFSKNGGSEYHLLPCLNSQEHWTKALAVILQKAHGI